MTEQIRILDTVPGRREPFHITPSDGSRATVTVDYGCYTAPRPLAPSLEGAALYFLAKQLERNTCPSTK